MGTWGNRSAVAKLTGLCCSRAGWRKSTFLAAAEPQQVQALVRETAAVPHGDRSLTHGLGGRCFRLQSQLHHARRISWPAWRLR